MTWAPDYATVAQLREFVRVPADDEADETAMQLAVTSASRAVDAECRRQFGSAEATRRFTARYSALWDLWEVELDDVATLAGAAVHYDPDGAGSYSEEITDSARWLPLNASVNGEPWTRAQFPGVTLPAAPGAVQVAATFGWALVPVPVQEATLLQASRFLVRRDSPFGVAGSPDAGSELRLLARVDPDVAVALRPYRRPRRQGGAVFA